jgi:hypothetical protein
VARPAFVARAGDRRLFTGAASLVRMFFVTSYQGLPSCHMRRFENTTRIRSVRSRGDVKQFIKHPFGKYRSDPHWVPPLLIDERQKLNPKKNPFYEHARMELFLAERNGEVLGRVAAIDDSLHNTTNDDNSRLLGGRSGVRGACSAPTVSTARSLRGLLGGSGMIPFSPAPGGVITSSSYSSLSV